MNAVNFEAKRTPVRLALVDAEGEFARAALAAETSGSKSAKDKIEDLRIEIEGHRQRLVEINAAERAARQRAEAEAARDLAQERREAHAAAEDALTRREQAAAAMQQAVTAMADALKKYKSATADLQAAGGVLEVASGFFIGSEDLGLMLTMEMARVGMYELCPVLPSGTDGVPDLTTVIRQRNTRALRAIERAMSAGDLPPAA